MVTIHPIIAVIAYFYYYDLVLCTLVQTGDSNS